jgi:glycosyltransferase involved in cell wall biosynthesis
LQRFGIAPHQIIVKPNAVPDPGAHDQAGEGFAFVGRICAEKGIGLLLAAWDRHRPGSLGPLRILGDGPMAAEVRAYAAGRPDVQLLGAGDAAAVQAVMRAASVVIVPSVWQDVLPTVAIEALANARPVLCTQRGGTPWIIQAAGWTVPARVDPLAAMLPVARRDAPALGPVARQRYLSTFTSEAVTGTLLAAYAEVVAASPAGARIR